MINTFYFTKPTHFTQTLSLLPSAFHLLYMCAHLPSMIVILNAITTNCYALSIIHSFSHRFLVASAHLNVLFSYFLFPLSQPIFFHLLIHYFLLNFSIPSIPFTFHRFHLPHTLPLIHHIYLQTTIFPTLFHLPSYLFF